MNKSKFILLSSILFSITQAADAVTVIDDFANGYQYTKTRDQWFAYASGGATVGNALNRYGYPNAVSTGYAGLSAINLTLEDYDQYQGAGIGFEAKGNGSHYNLVQCTGGFGYKYKGKAHRFALEWTKNDKPVTWYKDFLDDETEWTSVTISDDDFTPADWDGTESDGLNFSKVKNIGWNIPVGNPPITITDGSFQIKDFVCLGDMAVTPANSIAWAEVSTLFSQEKYTGSPIQSKVAVKFINPDGSTKTLSKDKDYTVTYSNNIAKGTATATVKGIGSYSGTKVLNFEITDLPQGGLFWTAANGTQLNAAEYGFITNGWWWAAPYKDASIFDEDGKIELWVDGEDNDSKNFLSVTPGVGIQTLLTTKNGLPDNPSSAIIGFLWRDNDETINIRDFGGLCLTYNLTGSPMLVQLELPDSYKWEEGYDRYYAVLEPGNHSVNIPWGEFFKNYGITKLQDVVENSKGVSLQLKNDAVGFVQSQFTLRKLGAYGSCGETPPPAAVYAGKTQKLSKGGLMWRFADILEDQWADHRVQTPEVKALRSDGDDDNDWQPEGDGSWTGGNWYSFTFEKGSVYQKGGRVSWTANGVQEGTGIQTKDGQGLIVGGGVFDNEYGLQARLVTEKGGEWDGSSGAALTFDWKGGKGSNPPKGTENISAFEGLCLVYNLTGDSLRLNIAWDGSQPKYPYNTHGLYGVALPPGNQSVNIPWSAFKKEWGLGELDVALEEAALVQIVLNSSLSKEKQALFTLREFGSLGSCSKGAPLPAFYGENNGLVPPPEPENILWDFASGDEDVKIIENDSKKNSNGWFYGYEFGGTGNGGWVSNDPSVSKDPSKDFRDNFNGNGLQVGLIANTSGWNDNNGDSDGGWYEPGGAGFAFHWNDPFTQTEDISNFGGLCLVYAMEGDAPSFNLELTVDFDAFNDWSTYSVPIPNTNGKKAMVNIPYADFYKTWGAVTKTHSLENSVGLSFSLRNDDPVNKTNAQITLLQLGKLGSCTVPRDEKVDFLSPDAPESPVAPEQISPIISDKKAVATPVISSLQLNTAPKGLNVVASSGAKLTLFNLKGNAVMQKHLGAGETFVSLQNLKSGIYIAQVRQGSQVKTIKVSR